MKLTHKLYTAFAAILLVLVVLIATTLFSIRSLVNTTSQAEQTFTVITVAEDIVKQLLTIQSGQRGYVISGNDEDKLPYDQGKTELVESLEQLKQLSQGSPTQLDRLEEFNTLYQRWLEEAMEPVVSIRMQYGPGAMGLDQAAYLVKQGRGREDMQAMWQLMDDFISFERTQLTQRHAEADQASVLAEWTTLLGGFIVAIVAIGSAWMFKKQLQNRLADAQRAIDAIADGQLNYRIQANGKDEIAQVLATLVAMQDKLRAMLGNIRNAVNELNESSGVVASTAEQLSASSVEQTQASDSVATAIQELSASIEQVSKNSEQARKIAHRSSDEASTSGKVIEQMTQAMDRINQAVTQASHRLTELDSQSEKINDIVSVIKGIADQTNLLALNAAIEAARAGEQGRGFSVVADEVRSLAQRTASSTDEIEHMVGEIQRSTRTSVQQMKRGVAEVEEGVELADMTGQAMVRIRESFNEVMQVVQEISDALKEQNRASDEVAETVERFAGMAQQNQQATSDSSATAHSLQALASQLNQTVKQFSFD
tara:strand:+ start:3736 stop:5358 length:1623 start_codon:yes stop_codon:yes gene_type:complete